jgi:hypothetical protein
MLMCTTALAGFHRFRPHCTVTPFVTYALGLSLVGCNRDHDRETFRSFTAYLLLGTVFLFKYGKFP